MAVAIAGSLAALYNEDGNRSQVDDSSWRLRTLGQVTFRGMMTAIGCILSGAPEGLIQHRTGCPVNADPENSQNLLQ